MNRLFLAPLLLLTFTSTAPANASPVDTDCYTAVGPLLHASGGTLSLEVRAAYLKWAESTVVAQLKQSGADVPADCLAEVDHDSTLRDAIFGSVYPPDASVLQNYAELRKDMGEDFMARYRSLAAAIAVSKRVKGVESADDLGNIGRDYQPGFWTDESLQVPGSDREKSYVKHIADFLTQTHAAALDVYQDGGLQSRLRDYLTQCGVDGDLIGEVGKNLRFGERLKYALVLAGQRPGARDPKPSTVDWLRHIVDLNEATPTSTPDAGGKPMPWPLFPVKSAPWPLLMPLAHPVPLTESSYIWEAFQGLHGDDRYHTYGPYRGDDDVMPDSLRPSRWFWDAWPDRIVHGGECVPISKGTCDLYSALGKPAMWCGQPGHANLISFQRVDNAWTAEIEQEFAGGPEVTNAQWYFNEDHGVVPRARDLYDWPGAEYHLGLALGMNVGLKSYMDTRIAVNIFRAMPAADRSTLGVNLMRGAIAENPYNPEPWYRLASAMTDPRLAPALIDAAVKKDPGLIDGRAGSMPNVTTNTTTASNQYWRAVSQYVAQYGLLDRPAPVDESIMQADYQRLRGVEGISGDDLANYAERYLRQSPSTPADVDFDRKQAAAGDIFGEIRMAQRLRDGDGVGQSSLDAKGLLAKAAHQGDAGAAILLARLNPAITPDLIKVSVSSYYTETQNPKHLIDGSGMTGYAHDNENGAGTMWHTADKPASSPAPGLPASPAWARFDFARPIAFDAVLIWNHNQLNLTDRGFRRARILGTVDGSTWTPLTTDSVVEVPRSTGDGSAVPSGFANQLAGQPLKSVIIMAEATDGNWGGSCYGLSAVRFVVKPVAGVVASAMVSVTPSSTYSDMQNVAHLIDGSGMWGEYHDNATYAETMWHCGEKPKGPPAAGVPYSPAWVRFDFSHPTRFGSLLVWNHNQLNLTDRGFRKAHIYATSDGKTWHSITHSATVEIPRADGTSLARPSSIPVNVDAPVKSVILAADPVDGNWGGTCYGLSAVRFVRAQESRKTAGR